MKLVFIHLILLVVSVDVQGQTRRSDTISVKFSMCETIRGDTVLFNSPNTYEGLKRFFNRNLRYPLDAWDSIPTTRCKVTFIIDKKGRVTGAWCAAGPPDTLISEVVRVARKLGRLAPTCIKGKPVFTRVEMLIVYYESGKDELLSWDDQRADILVGIPHGCRLPANRGTVH